MYAVPSKVAVGAHEVGAACDAVPFSDVVCTVGLEHALRAFCSYDAARTHSYFFASCAVYFDFVVNACRTVFDRAYVAVSLAGKMLADSAPAAVGAVVDLAVVETQLLRSLSRRRGHGVACCCGGGGVCSANLSSQKKKTSVACDDGRGRSS